MLSAKNNIELIFGNQSLILLAGKKSVGNPPWRFHWSKKDDGKKDS